MITVYQKTESGSFAVADSLPARPVGIAWIDLCNPTTEEELHIESLLSVEILTREEIWKNQVLNRFYVEDGVAYMTAAVINKTDTPYPQTSSITFILGPRFLITLRYITPTSFQKFTQRMLRRPQEFCSSSDILEGLLEEIITRVAYNSEIVVGELDKLSHNIFGIDSFENSKKNPSQMMKEILQRLGASADLNSKISESLHSLGRMLAFFRHMSGNSENINTAIGTLMTDVSALTQQTSFLSDKITLQLDATLGMINVEQNMIVKIFSIATVFFLPPTLVSSIYGMNFAEMPELHWMYGYPMAIGMMVLLAAVPFFYFRRKGWL